MKGWLDWPIAYSKINFIINFPPPDVNSGDPSPAGSDSALCG
jgi:hypothetical protein